MASMGKTHLDLAFLLALLILPAVAHASQQLSSARPSLPPALQDHLSPLSRQQEIYYGKFIKRRGAEAMSESILYEFCKSARLLCSASLQESTWGSAIGVETLSLTLESHIRSLAFGKSVFTGWSPKAEKSASKTGIGEVETASLAFDRSVFAGWSPKGEKSLSLPSETGMGEVETTSLAFGKSVFTGWSPKAEKPSPSASKTGTGKAEPAHLFVERWASRTEVTGTEPEGLKQHLTAAKYFREEDLMVGIQVVLPHFLYQPTSQQNKAIAELKPSFLPASIALNLPPFDTPHLEDLLLLFHIPFNTHMAQKMEETLMACEGQSLGKDDNFITSLCATSFEAMLKFASSMVRAPYNKIQAVTNSKVVGRVGGKVTIVQTAELAAGHDTVDCHELMFPFKVMGCHRIKESKVILVRMADEEGVNNMDLLVACHKNTTLFEPQHEAFAELQSSPGRTEICHFLPNSDIMWIPL